MNFYSLIPLKSLLTFTGKVGFPFKLQYSGTAGALMQSTFLFEVLVGKGIPFITISLLSNKKSDGYEQLNQHKSVKYRINYILKKVIN